MHSEPDTLRQPLSREVGCIICLIGMAPAHSVISADADVPAATEEA